VRKQNKRAELTLQSIITIIIGLTLAAACFAWFYNMQQVQGGGMAVNVETDEFEAKIVEFYAYEEYTDYDSYKSSTAQTYNPDTTPISEKSLLQPYDAVFTDRNDKTRTVLKIEVKHASLQAGRTLHLYFEQNPDATGTGTKALTDIVQFRAFAATSSYSAETLLAGGTPFTGTAQSFWSGSTKLTEVEISVPISAGALTTVDGMPATYIYVELSYYTAKVPSNNIKTTVKNDLGKIIVGV